MNRLDIRRWPLAAKFTLSITLMVTLAVATVTLLSLQRERDTFRSELRQQAQLALELIEEVSANPLYRLDADTLQEVVEELDESDMLLGGYIYDADGRLVADSTATQELVFQIDPDPYGQRLVASDEREYDWLPDRLRAGQAVVLGRQRIGAIAVELSTAPLDSKIADVRNEGLEAAAITIIAGIMLALLLSRSITTPIKELARATERIAAGDMTQKATVAMLRPGLRSGPALNGKAAPSTNEIGQLAMAFNEMADAIQKRETALREQAETLRVANARAEEAARIKSEFLANVSHELRTPLNVILGFSDMMLLGIDGALNEKQHHKVERLRENGARLLVLINDILDLSRLEAKRVELVNKPFAPRALADRLATQATVLAAQKQLEFKQTIAPDLPTTLIGDEKRVEQIALNLLSNAAKFTETGSITLEMGAKADDHSWQIRVTDTGVGIPPHALDLIFEEFRQVDGSPTRAYMGTGLGLAIARNFARLMGGNITVESELHAGSAFTVTLPLVLEEAKLPEAT
jgi:signal transduction histidine kinase